MITKIKSNKNNILNEWIDIFKKKIYIYKIKLIKII